MNCFAVNCFFDFCEIACTVSFSSTQKNFKVLSVQVPDIFVCIVIVILGDNEFNRFTHRRCSRVGVQFKRVIHWE